MLGGGALSWDHLSPFPPLGSDLEVPGSREGGFLGSSLRGSGGFFLDDGVLLPSSGFGTRWQKLKSRSTCWVGSTAPHPTPSSVQMSPGDPGIQASTNGTADLRKLEERHVRVTGCAEVPSESGIGLELRWWTQWQWTRAGARTGSFPDPTVLGGWDTAPSSGPHLGPLV